MNKFVDKVVKDIIKDFHPGRSSYDKYLLHEYCRVFGYPLYYQDLVKQMGFVHGEVYK